MGIWGLVGEGGGGGAERGKSRRKYGSKEDSDRAIGKAF